MTVYIAMHRDGGSVSVTHKETKTEYYIDHRVGSDTKGLVFSDLHKYIVVCKNDAKEVARELKEWLTIWLDEQPITQQSKKIQVQNIVEIIENAVHKLEEHYDEFYTTRFQEFESRRRARIA